MKQVFNKNQFKGFSLVEVLVTTLILGVGMLGAAKFQSSIVQSSKLSKQQVEAVNLAKKLIEPTLHFSTAAQYETFLAIGNGENETQGTTDTYNSHWTIAKTNNSRGANVTLKVDWGSGESIYLSTIVSNTTPSAITHTSQAPARDPATDPIFVPLNFPAVDPVNPANGENICRCKNNGNAMAFNSIQKPNRASNFVKVSDDGGGMMGDWYDKDGDGSDDDSSDSDEAVITGNSEECNLCCADAVAASVSVQTEKYYAQLEALFLKKARFTGDQVIGNNGFDPRYLIKGYQTNSLDNDIKKFLQNTGDDHDWSSDDGTDDSTPNYDFTAACGIDYDPAPEPTVAEPAPKPVPKRSRCIYFRNN